MLDHHHRVAGVDQAAEHLQQVLDVRRVQAGGRLVEDVEGAAGGAAAQFLGQFDPLGLATGEGHRTLAQGDVAQADVDDGLQPVLDGRHVLEEVQCLLHRHGEDFGNGPALVTDVQGLLVVAFALAALAGDVQVRQEVHGDADDAVALAGLAAAALDVEAEPAGPVAARP